MKIEAEGGLFGLMAEFGTAQDLISAAEKTHEAGFAKADAYSPYPIEEVWEALGEHRSRMPLIVLVGGVLGALAGFFLQYWVATTVYPMNIGGRPLNSWIAFVPVTFEMTILIASLAAVFGMFALNGLPMPYHPVFNAKRFALASRDRYFLCIEAEDPQFDLRETRSFLESLNPTEVSEVEL